MVVELARLGTDLDLDRLAPALDHLGFHGVRRQDAGQPFDGEKAVFRGDGHIVPGVVAVGDAVAPPAQSLHGVLDLLLGPAGVFREEHVLGKVRELFPARRVGVRADGDAHADRDVGRPGQALNQILTPLAR